MVERLCPLCRSGLHIRVRTTFQKTAKGPNCAPNMSTWDCGSRQIDGHKIIPGWKCRARVAEAEVKRLQAIVDKPPKCWRLNEQGKLVQDVPVTVGMDIWYRRNAVIACGETRDEKQYREVDPRVFWHRVGRDWIWEKTYSTYKAAKAKEVSDG